MHNLKFKKITVALCLAFMPISLLAAGLGKLNVMSGLGEPLKADIELISVTPADLSSITAAIASEEAYTTQGIEKPASHNTIKVEVGKNASGAPILKLKSAQPISEPFLDMLIQVDWASGRLLREYTVLLDPPGYAGEADNSVKDTLTTEAPVVKQADTDRDVANASISSAGEAATSSSSTSSSSKGSKKTSKRNKKSEAPTEVDPLIADAPLTNAASQVDASGQEHFTQKGDTLAEIAREMKPEGVSLEQMLVGLYQTNPDAFQGNNMNRLKVGQIIRQPTEESLNAVTRKEASREIKVQTSNWNAYRNKLAGIVQESTPSEAESGGTQSAGGKIKSAAEDKSIPAAIGPQDVVKLSAGEAAAAKATAENVKSLQDKISALQEESTAREKGLKEAQGRVSDLEKQIADMQKLLALKNGAMAEIQKQAEAEKNKPAEVVVTPAEPAKPVEQPKPAEAEKPSEPVKPAEQVPEATTAPVEASTPKPVAIPAVEPVPEPSFLDGILGGVELGPLLPIGGGLLALLGGGWFYLRKKREKNLADFEQGIMTSGGLKANTVFGNTGTASVDTGDTSFLTDFSQSASGGMIDTNDVDPIAEAEVYMAYGRDAQAEEILKDAISKEPKRYELHLKLLEMYAASKNMSAFETISGELYTTLGSEDPTWAKVAAIGIKLEPNNPLYQAGSVPQGTSVGGADSLGNEKSSKQDASAKLDASDFSDSPLAAEKDLDFSLDSDSMKQGFAPTGTVKGGEFDLDLGKTETQNLVPADTASDLQAMEFTIDVPAETSAMDTPKNAEGMDFDFGNLNSTDLTSDIDEPVKKVAEFVQTMPSLDIDTFQEPKFMPDSATEIVDTISDRVRDLKDAITVGGFEFPMPTEAPEDAGVLDISALDTDTKESNDDFNFNLDNVQPESSKTHDEELASSELPSAKEEEANPIDLTGIDLDLNGSESTVEMMAVVSEPIEVETKLELVVAYIEMDDKEGAKELLDEVMKEGGANQRKRAEELLAKIT